MLTKFQFVIENLRGNREYVVKICAGTKSISKPDQPLLGDPSGEARIFLPEEECQLDSSTTSYTSFQDFQAELSAGMIVGAVCAVLFLLLAVIGFVIWRYNYYIIFHECRTCSAAATIFNKVPICILARASAAAIHSPVSILLAGSSSYNIFKLMAHFSRKGVTLSRHHCDIGRIFYSAAAVAKVQK